MPLNGMTVRRPFRDMQSAASGACSVSRSQPVAEVTAAIRAAGARAIAGVHGKSRQLGCRNRARPKAGSEERYSAKERQHKATQKSGRESAAGAGA